MYLKTNDKTSCCGCLACVDICPNSCLTVSHDNEGFVYPKCDKHLCLNCSLCEKVCPMVDTPPEKTQDAVYAIRYADQETVSNSASGGAFTAIVDAVASSCNPIIYGAQFDENLVLRHTFAEPSNIYKFRKSKYLQSDTQGVFLSVKANLDKNIPVLFSGLPCQVWALKRYLGESENNKLLLCVDLVCHGVPNQKMFSSYLEELEKANNAKVVDVTFRYKTKASVSNSRSLKIEYADGRIEKYNEFSSPFLRGYHDSLFYRPSCYNCPFANERRAGDITIGDFWGIEKYYEIDPHSGISLVIINSRKGKATVDIMLNDSCWMQGMPKESVEQNRQLFKAIHPHRTRDKFFLLWPEHGFSRAVNKCTKSYASQKIIWSILGPVRARKMREKFRQVIQYIRR